MTFQEALSRRERQIMEIIYRLGSATAAEVQAALSGQPTNSAVRTMLRILEEKGHLRHEDDGHRYVFFPTVVKQTAVKEAVAHVLATFFDGSVEQVVATLLDLKREVLAEEDYQRLVALIDQARREGK